MTPLQPAENLQTMSGASPLGIAGVVLLFAAAIGFFGLSLTNRHGRSRWPLHALMATGIVGIGSGVIAMGVALSIAQLDAVATKTSPFFGQVISGPLWLVIGGTFAGALAGIRALIGMFREPGPRF